MTLNRTVSDLAVKSIRIQKRSGSSWIRPPEAYFVAGAPYRTAVTFGNTAGRIFWGDEQYRKDHVNIRLVSMGFKIGDRFYDKQYLWFYTNASYATPVSGDRWRTHYDIHTFETVHTDVLFYAYFKIQPGIRNRNISTWYWDAGIYASVRDRVWRKRASAL